MEPEEYREVSDLVARVFRADVAPHYSQEGIDEFLTYASPDALLNRSRQNHFVLVARVEEGIIGAIEVRNHSHISLLFVDSAYQRQGIAKELLRRALQRCQAHDPDLQAFTVNASPNAVGAYEQFGFQAQGPLQVRHGIAFVPMVLSLEASDPA